MKPPREGDFIKKRLNRSLSSDYLKKPKNNRSPNDVLYNVFMVLIVGWGTILVIGCFLATIAFFLSIPFAFLIK